MYSLTETFDALAAQFTNSFPTAVTTPRTVGREAEYPVVTAMGEAADVRRLWESLLAYGDLHEHYDSGTPNLIVGLEGEDFTYELEVGVGTVEIVTRPCHDLFEVQRLVELAMRRLVRAAARFGWQVLGYGVQPRTRPLMSIMAPKQRYHSLYRAMGAEWLWYTVTASDQCHVAIGRDEVLSLLNYGNLIAPILIAFCANSPVYSDKLSPFCSGREGEMVLIHANEARHGMPKRAYTSMADYVETLAQATYLIRRANNEVYPSSRPFTEYLSEHGSDFEAFLFHEHYVWNSARVRSAYGTIELRPACQQPWAEHMAAMALSVGLIEAAQPIEAYIQQALGEGYWATMRQYHQQVIRLGLAAPQPAPDFLATIVTLAEQGLRQRGQGEDRLLQPIHKRLGWRQNPAQRMRLFYQREGMNTLLAAAAIRPGTVMV